MSNMKTGLYDVHCHILPGVDDGAKTTEDAMELLREEWKQGVRHIILTPHYRKGMFEPSKEKVEESFASLKKAAAEAGLEMELLLGCEYHAISDMEDELCAGNRHTMANTDYVLVEFSHSSSKSFIRERLSNLRNAGFTPIVAHAERYDAFRDGDFMEEITETGNLIQLNAAGIMGKEGFRTGLWCRKQLRQGNADLIGSDAHNLGDRAPNLAACYEYIRRKFGEELAEELMVETPGELFSK